MVQFINLPESVEGRSQSALGSALGMGLSKMGERQMAQQNQSALANALFGIPDLNTYQQLSPDQQLAIAKLDSSQQKNQVDEQSQLRDYQTIEKTFGKKFADLWQSAPQGGKTELVRVGLDALLRGENLQELLSGLPEETTNQDETSYVKDDIPNEMPQMQDGNLPSNFKYPDFNKRPSGFTPKEWRDERKTWRQENVPIFSENKRKLSNTRRDMLSTESLKKIDKSGKLPEGLASIIIDRETGDIKTLASLAGIASPEAQQWVKELARFQNRAKDAFGSRVTNFDLQSYMRQFPNLLNTKEGRERILKMMDINYKLDELHQNAIDKVYKKYGLGNIPQEAADEMAQKMIVDDVNRLEKEYLRVSEGVEIVSSLRNQGYSKGDTAKDSKTGQRYIFDGKEWQPMDEKQ